MTDRGTLVNDVHAQLNATVVRRVLRPASVDDVREAVLKARAAGRAIAIAGPSSSGPPHVRGYSSSHASNPSA